MELSCRNDNGNIVHISEVLKYIHKCNEIKYASYRMASKVRILQKALRTDILTLNIIEGVFERHRYHTCESKLQLDLTALENLLSDIFFASNKLGEHCIDVEACVCLMIQFLARVFAINKGEMINALSIKLLLCVLCNETFENKCHFMFKHSADHNMSVTRLNLKLMLWPLAKLGDFLEEGLWFGTHLILAVVNDCFVSWPGHLGLIESAFNDWMSTNPDWFSWLHILQKFNAYDGYTQQCICSSCNKYPIEGLVFRCCKCRDYFQCVNCFSRAIYSKTHRPSHKMEEIRKTKHQKRTKKKFKNNFLNLPNLMICFKKTATDNTNLSSSNSNQLNIVTKSECILNKKTENTKDTLIKLNQSKISVQTIYKNTSNLQERLQFVINQLELQIREMRTQRISETNILPDIEKHLNLIELQCVSLKEIKKLLKSSVDYRYNNSTPLPNTSNRTNNLDVDILSPIPIDKNKSKEILFSGKTKLDSQSKFSEITVKDENDVGENICNMNESCFITVQSYVDKHLIDHKMDNEKISRFNYRDRAQISSFTFDETADDTYASDESSEKSFNVDSTITSKADINVLIKKLHDILNVSDCDNAELSRSASKLESCLSNIIDSLEIDTCLQKLKISGSPSLQNTPSTSTGN